MASRLFAELGVNGTTMAEIARRSGLQQSSLYYYFKSKEQVLGAVVVEANRAPLQLVERIRADGGSPVTQLYRMIRADVAALCGLPYDLNELHRVAARDASMFNRYWKERHRLEAALAEVVQEGVDAGELLPIDAHLAALTILSNDEGTQNWMRNDPRRRGKTKPTASEPYAIGTFLADLTVRGLMQTPRDLDNVRRRSDALDARSAVSQ